jgi:poly(3-hydroxybutyrate) depolymerase
MALLAIVSSLPLRADETAAFVEAAGAKHGGFGSRAAKFLVEHMPAADKTAMKAADLSANLDLAMEARAAFPWAAKVPDEVFFNDVLPYAVFDETRDPWRAEFLAKARPLVQGAKTASEAAQALNRGFFKLINVHYHTGRRAPNQSAKESMQLGKASCSGLSIILVNACRAVGVPARAVGTPMWANQRGNHTWVEIWDGGWHFTGADEYDAAGLNRGWFTEDAGKAVPGHPLHAIYATSWKKAGLAFPLVWAPRHREVAAVDVTSRYAKAKPADGPARLGVRLVDRSGGTRVAARVRLAIDGGPSTTGTTKAGTSDLNDMPRFDVAAGATGRLYANVDGAWRFTNVGAVAGGDPTIDAVWQTMKPVAPALAKLLDWLETPEAERESDDPRLDAALTRDDAAAAATVLAGDRMAGLADARRDELAKRSITLEGKTLRWLERTFGERPKDGRSLWISMHGGGGAPPQVNDQQWANQIQLYEPAEGIYLAPRAPTDTWNLWHEGHIDPLFQRLIEDHVILRGVNPDKVYLMGYSAGGDGVWQLGPRMADRFAAAAMMAGHPNESSLNGLRNLPFAVFMGANDAAYDRNRLAAEKSAELDRLAKADPGGYVHLSRIYPGLGHWMNRKDAEAVPWMAGHRRVTWPKRVVWQQDDVLHDRFYWVKIPDATAAKAGQKITAAAEGQVIRLEGEVPSGTELRLSDALLNLDQKVSVIVNGKPVSSQKVVRNAGAIHRTLTERFDPQAAAHAILRLP